MKIELFFLLFALCAVLAQRKCKNSECVVLEDCPKIFEQTKARDVNSYKILNQRNCGFEARTTRVCCKNEERYFSDRDMSSNDTSNKAGETLLPKDCGNDFSARIVGGNVTDPGEYPWLALLEFDSPLGTKFGCGGALINEKYVLTAAHCVRNLPNGWSVKSVRLGEHNTDTDPDCIPDGDSGDVCSPPILNVPVEEAIPHSSYENKNQQSDIALLRLSRSVKFTEYIKPICLPDNSALAKKFIVAGWGLTEDGIFSNLQLKVTIPLVTTNTCQTSYSTVYPPRRILSTQICAGGEKGKDSCRGDSGGPLMQKDLLAHGVARWFAVGVTSYGPTPCGMEGWPGVYTNVFRFRNWIVSNMKP